jgi:hypothetical protein
MVGYEAPTFFIKGGDGSFTDRQKNIFEKLTVAEKERNERQQELDDHTHSNNIISAGNSVSSRKRCRSEKKKNRGEESILKRPGVKKYKGEESIFKKPDVPPPRFKNKGVPDYHRNPHKWIKYSLADVSQEDMSDQSNTAAALSFLKEMQERKSQEEMEVDDITQPLIIFKHPNIKMKRLSQYDTSFGADSGMTNGGRADEYVKPCFQSSKLVMPEYVVGVTKKKDKKKQEKPDHLPQNENISSKIILQHLTEEDEGE